MTSSPSSTPLCKSKSTTSLPQLLSIETPISESVDTLHAADGNSKPAVEEPTENANEEESVMRVEVLYFDGCPGHETLLPRLRDLMDQEGVDAPIELKSIKSAQTAERERFLGSPTLRINGEDVDATAGSRADFGLKCRLYATADGLQGAIPDELMLASIRAHQDKAG